MRNIQCTVHAQVHAAQQATTEHKCRLAGVFCCHARTVELIQHATQQQAAQQAASQGEPHGSPVVAATVVVVVAMVAMVVVAVT